MPSKRATTGKGNSEPKSDEKVKDDLSQSRRIPCRCRLTLTSYFHSKILITTGNLKTKKLTIVVL